MMDNCWENVRRDVVFGLGHLSMDGKRCLYKTRTREQVVVNRWSRRIENDDDGRSVDSVFCETGDRGGRNRLDLKYFCFWSRG
jgi:hypothetical protein